MNLLNANSGKSLPAASNYLAPVAPDRPAPAPDFSRRPGPSSSAATSAQPTPRKGQGFRKQHRNQRRPGLGDRMVHSPLDRDDAFAEMRAVRNPSSRRGQTSITHLLNYTAPRTARDHNFHPRPHRRHPNAGSGYHAVDKSRYVHANYRFVVRPNVSYTDQAADADLYIDWANVLQVIASSESQTASCPICLSEPVAPRMARCGHIFCLPCLIRFMVTTTNEEDAKSGKIAKWKKCPICEDSVYMQEVRPVRFYAGQESPLPRPGDDVVLRLMARKANSTLALPREGGVDVINSSDDVPWHFAANVLDYARIMKGTTEYMTEQYEGEVAALKKQEKEDEDLFGQDGVWMQRAVKAVKSLLEGIDDLTDVAAATLATNRVRGKPMSDSDFYFYSTPPHLYLSPLDIRILKTKYGSFSSFPSSLLPTLEHISTGHVVDDNLRKRAKYLGHLPQGCVISFLECDWTDIVPEDTLSTFASDIAKRRKRNTDKAAQEELKRINAERLEAAALHSSAGISIPHQGIEEDGPPAMDISEFQPLNGPSSATPPEDRLGFNPLACMSTSPTGERTVWGTVAVPASPEMGSTHAESRNDGWLNEAELLSNAELSMDLEAIHIAEQEGGAKPENGGSAGGGKKKKKQKITLMSTGGRRGF
ncbi:Zinc finger domain-containing protein, C3HC4 RING-type [Cordyceps fumosorosea ARSEF 2679]|uniref:Zinc finger domain-containing protein, C3HC4 RING-type n=1 Tax=Cordyceps fumosorosea (strain ARSEF 2679) TaxID=1081104 RepID=A0A167LF05_CORFA|nr:Zinc finger domain-containing protein, C3HC4 RING-type [Cordyceps fumosorosea ARSEF 2679]OAA53009.1 Zinc finger domain-containing protein, C3HC4 RING-type [Cordyceps fumosorosea ARSEF 2679]